MCIASPIVRLGSTVERADLSGQWLAALDLAHPPTAAVLPIMAGSRWRFQAWYRDLNPLPTSNFSEAVEVPFR